MKRDNIIRRGSATTHTGGARKKRENAKAKPEIRNRIRRRTNKKLFYIQI
jgi:hypothetical protein